MSVYREPPSALASFQRRWAAHDADAVPPPADGAALAAFAYAIADAVARAILPLALDAQGFAREATLLRSGAPLDDERPARVAAQLLRDLVHEPTLRRMRHVHALTSAARVVEEAIGIAAAARAGTARLRDLEGFFADGAALDMAAYRAVAGGAPHDDVVALFAACFEEAAG